MIGGGRGFALERNRLLCHTGVLAVSPALAANLNALLGVLNSRVFAQFLRLTSPTMGISRYALRLHRFKQFPLPSGLLEPARGLCENVVAISKQLLATPADPALQQEFFAHLDQSVDRLYGLSSD